MTKLRLWRRGLCPTQPVERYHTREDSFQGTFDCFVEGTGLTKANTYSTAVAISHTLYDNFREQETLFFIFDDFVNCSADEFLCRVRNIR